MANHIRSISLPATSHPFTSRIEEELLSVKASLASSCKTSQIMGDVFRVIGDLHGSIHELLCLPSYQSLFHSQKKWIQDQQLDDSLKMLDLISAVKDGFVAIREHAHDLRSTIRRKENAATVSSKKFKNAIKDCFRALRRMDVGSLPSSAAIKDSDILIKAHMEARESTISLLQSVMAFLSKPTQKASKWSIITKVVSKRKLGCENELDAATSGYMLLQASYDFLACKDVGSSQILKAKNHLKTLEIGLETLESGLEYLFRRLIQNRVSLLNLLAS